MGVLGTASLPSSQTICSPGCECCELAWGQSRTAIWPLCTRRSTQPRWVPRASTARGRCPGALCLGVANASCAGFAGAGASCLGVAIASCAGFADVLPMLRHCCACPGMPWLLREEPRAQRCSAGQGAWSGQGSCLAVGTGLTSSPGPWPAALASQRPVSHMQPYLLAWSCLQGLITSGQSSRWCSAAGSSRTALQS